MKKGGTNLKGQGRKQGVKNEQIHHRMSSCQWTEDANVVGQMFGRVPPAHRCVCDPLSSLVLPASASLIRARHLRRCLILLSRGTETAEDNLVAVVSREAHHILLS